VFCRLANSQDWERDLLLFQNEELFLVLNRYPYNNGHLMLIPNRHEASLEALPAEVAAALIFKLQWVVAQLKKAYGCDGLNLGMNLGTAAGAGIAEHLHFHILPRWRGDTNFMPALAGVNVMPEHLYETWRGLKPFFSP